MKYHLGVDLGTTYTAAATARDGHAQPVTLGARSVAVPSVVYLSGDELLVGEVAVRHAASEPGRVAREFKRRVGDPTPILLGGSPIGAELLMARMLKWVVTQVTTTEGTDPASIAVTHPANWGEYKLDLLRQAIRHVGVSVDHYVPEPAAAASFYAAQRDVPDGATVAVYDLGGGTFDAAVVRRDGNSFRIIGRPDGIERLGGIDFDHAIINYVADNLGLDLHYPPPADMDDPAMLAGLIQLRQDCVEAKEALSSETDVSIPVLLPNRHTEVRLTRLEFEAMIRPAINETIIALRRAVDSAGQKLDNIAAVLLVGGSSRIPMVGFMVSEQLRRPVAIDANPKDAISLGASLLAWRAARPAPPATPGRPAPPVDTRPAPPIIRPAPPIAAAAAAGAAVAAQPRPAAPTPAPAPAPTPAPTPAVPVANATPPAQRPPPPVTSGQRPAAPITSGQRPTAPITSGQRPAAPAPSYMPPSQPPMYTAAGGAGPSNPQNRTWLIAGAAAIIALIAVALILSTQGGNDDPNQGADPTDQSTPDGSDDSTPPDDDGDTGDPGGLGDLGVGALEALPGDDWGDAAQAQFVEDCSTVFATAAEQIGGATFDTGAVCGCMYDDISASGVSLADFNAMWTGENSDLSGAAFDAYSSAANTCAIEGIDTGT